MRIESGCRKFESSVCGWASPSGSEHSLCGHRVQSQDPTPHDEQRDSHPLPMIQSANEMVARPRPSPATAAGFEELFRTRCGGPNPAPSSHRPRPRQGAPALCFFSLRGPLSLCGDSVRGDRGELRARWEGVGGDVGGHLSGCARWRHTTASRHTVPNHNTRRFARLLSHGWSSRLSFNPCSSLSQHLSLPSSRSEHCRSLPRSPLLHAACVAKILQFVIQR